MIFLRLAGFFQLFLKYAFPAFSVPGSRSDVQSMCGLGNVRAERAQRLSIWFVWLISLIWFVWFVWCGCVDHRFPPPYDVGKNLSDHLQLQTSFLKAPS